MSKHRHAWLVGRLLLGCLVFTMLLGNDEGFLVFQPEQLTINAGDIVRFEVRGLGPHNLIVAGHAEWSHEPLSFAAGESWEQQFDCPAVTRSGVSPIGQQG